MRGVTATIHGVLTTQLLLGRRSVNRRRRSRRPKQSSCLGWWCDVVLVCSDRCYGAMSGCVRWCWRRDGGSGGCAGAVVLM
ncbi:Hypothetical predicted protein [Olea europaea subsp. europaea]|uniref:Uncharacterized protein n=1 Tax=Olea europaea subsp. europaea TaxID=158383 RepID=A0A8S0UCW9_OLEEU|nr:Hypothetical predicted protein [Olea europaea subsp. europaea]